MKNIVGWVLLGFIFSGSPLYADYYSIKDGIWEVTTSSTCPWSKVSHVSPTCACSPGCSPGGNFVINIRHVITSSCSMLDFSGGATIHVLAGGNFTLNGGGTLAGTANIIIDEGGSMVINGNLNLQGNGSGTINGSLTVNGSITNSSSLGSDALCGSGSITSTLPILPGTLCNYKLLPVEFACFKSEKHLGGELLHWETLSEMNNLKFEVQKSFDGFEFETIGEVYAKTNGNSKIRLQYDFFDIQPVNKFTYYRLKQIDFNNNFKYSQIISVNYSEYSDASFIVYPNPNKSEFFLDYRGVAEQEKMRIQVVDFNGRMVYEQLITQHNNGENTIKIKPDKTLQSNRYLIRIVIGEVVHHLTMLIE